MKKSTVTKKREEKLMEWYIIIQSVILSGIAAWFSSWCLVEGNKTIVTFLNGVNEEPLQNPQILSFGFWMFGIFLVFNGVISLLIYLIILSIKKLKRVKK